MFIKFFDRDINQNMIVNINNFMIQFPNSGGTKNDVVFVNPVAAHEIYSMTFENKECRGIVEELIGDKIAAGNLTLLDLTKQDQYIKTKFMQLKRKPVLDNIIEFINGLQDKKYDDYYVYKIYKTDKQIDPTTNELVDNVQYCIKITMKGMTAGQYSFTDNFKNNKIIALIKEYIAIGN